MISSTPQTSLQDKIQKFPFPSMNLETPVHIHFLTSQIKNLHGKLESRLYSYLNPKNAEITTKLLYAIPASVLVKILSGTHIATLSLMGGAYLWCCKEELISKKAKVDLLHSIAIGFFANMFNLSTEFSMHALTRIPFDASLLAATLAIANQIENTPSISEELSTHLTHNRA